MTGKKQKNRSAGARPVVIRVLTIIAAIVALAVSAAPASARVAVQDFHVTKAHADVKGIINNGAADDQMRRRAAPVASAGLSKKPALRTFSGDAYVNEMG
jgi:hypothetical protein